MKIKFFVATIEQLKAKENFLNYLDHFNQQTKTNVWSWLDTIAQNIAEHPYQHYEGIFLLYLSFLEADKGYIVTKTHHLFLYAFHLHGDKLIVGSYYNTIEQTFGFVGNSMMLFCKFRSYN